MCYIPPCVGGPPPKWYEHVHVFVPLLIAAGALLVLLAERLVHGKKPPPSSDGA